MIKESIKINLLKSHQSFAEYISGLSDFEFNKSKDGKWTAGQQLEHIHLAVKPLILAFTLPKFLLKLLFGTAIRESRTYDELVKKYLIKLESGGRASGPFIPKTVSVEKGQRLKLILLKEVKDLSSKLDRFTEADLDLYVLPHPLLGKLTIREMMYFTIYHVSHHQELIKRYVKD